MPELPEVHTTVSGINRFLRGLVIKDVWTNYFSAHYKGKNEIKNPVYFKKFAEDVVGGKILQARRRGKNILIDLSNGNTILIHMKMTGHLLYGQYKRLSKTKEGAVWEAPADPLLKDSFNQFIHLVFILSNGKHLVLSDVRRFAKVCVFPTKEIGKQKELAQLGPEPLEKTFSLNVFKGRLKKKKGPIKKILMDQSVIAGIGNIYSDEILWRSAVHPLWETSTLSETSLSRIFTALKTVLKKGIDLGGDSMSDYRDIEGKRGKFQETHKAYRNTGKACEKKGCRGKIVRIIVNGRSTHFCPEHQKGLN
ncbi:MAG: bifunctional DNA-formamidopyrimidine glycosylase/DNA-(apurinic or apyrimidinic site) lyase [Patescibacteria group bacterium]